MRLRIEKGVARGEISAPPSKSIAHRLLIAAALCEATSRVHCVSQCEDVHATMDCLTALGVRFEVCGADVIVHGINIKHAKPATALFCRESGSTLRFLLPISMISGHTAVFEGAERLMQRPMTIYENLAAEKAVHYQSDNRRITVCGPLKCGVYTFPGNVSSQFISGLLFALPLVEGDSVIHLTTPIESRSYVELTIAALHKFGVSVTWADAQTLHIKGGQAYHPADVAVEADASGAAFPAALNYFGGSVTINGLYPDSLQADAVYPELFAALDTGTPTISVMDCPDLAPILFAVAAAKNGGTFLDTKRLKIKESDRAEAMASELRKFGTCVTVRENSVVIEPKQFHKPNDLLRGYNDHRIVMALCVLLSITGGEIDGAEAVSKSYPEFFIHLKSLGIEVKEI